MRHSGVCEGCWIIKLTPLRRNLHDSRHGYDTILSSHTVSAALSLLTADTATDPVYCHSCHSVISVPSGEVLWCWLHSCEIAPFRMPRLAHVLRAEPQISLRRTGRCPAWDRVDGLGFMHHGRIGWRARPPVPVNVVYVHVLRCGCIFEILLLDIGDRMGITKLNTSDTARRVAPK